MYDNKLYWIFIQQSLGYGSRKVKHILKTFGTSENFYKSGKDSWFKSKLFSEKELKKLSEFDFKIAENVINHCNKNNYSIITLNDDNYPTRLKNISNPPPVLFVNGNLPDFDNNVTISIVGTRSASEYGRKVAYYFGKNLAELGTIIVSGGALGIDSTAQKGALDAFGKVVSVLGCGLDCSYIKRTDRLNKLIVNSGALITEFLPNCSALPRHFPIRNRIISGLSLGTIIVEADLRSGALITAKLALEQNRDVFAVPGNITSRNSRGTNKIIKEWAKPVTNIEDVLEEYYSVCPKFNFIKNNSLKNNTRNSKRQEPKKELPEDISQLAKNLYKNLTKTPITMDALIAELQVDTQSFLQAVTELELYGLIKSGPGRNYSKL